MKIKYFAHLRDCTRTSEESYTGSAQTLRALLNDLCQQYGAAFRKWVFTPEGELSGIAIVLVNGKDVRDHDWLETTLSPVDDICIFPPVAGG
jgi:MoaD family protein